MISLFGSLRKATAIVLLGAMFFGFSSPVFAVAAVNYFTSSISPATTTAGVSQSYTLTITNSASNSNEEKIGSVIISIPS